MEPAEKKGKVFWENGRKTAKKGDKKKVLAGSI